MVRAHRAPLALALITSLVAGLAPLAALAAPPEPGWLGLRLEPANEAEQKSAGVERPVPKVTRVFPASPALAAGLEAGDLVLAIDGQDVADVRDLVNRVGGSPAGSTLVVRVYRGSSTVEKRAVLAAKPDQQALYRSEWDGKPLPPLDFQHATDPARVQLSPESTKGKVVILDYFATWCGPCKRLSRDLHALYEREKTHGLDIVAITSEELDVVRPWALTEQHPYPVLVDDKKMFEEQFAPSVMPTIWVVDKKGVVRGVWLGSAEYPSIEKKVMELLAE